MLRHIILTTLMFTYWDFVGSETLITGNEKADDGKYENRFENNRIQWKNLKIKYMPYKLNRLKINSTVLFFDLARSMIKTALPQLKNLNEKILGEIFDMFLISLILSHYHCCVVKWSNS